VGSTFTAATTGASSGNGTALQFALLVAFGIDQLPVLSASNVTVTLV